MEPMRDTSIAWLIQSPVRNDSHQYAADGRRKRMMWLPSEYFVVVLSDVAALSAKRDSRLIRRSLNPASWPGPVESGTHIIVVARKP